MNQIKKNVHALLQQFDRALTREERVEIRSQLQDIRQQFESPTGEDIKAEVWTKGEYLLNQYPAQIKSDNRFMLMPHQTFLKKWVSQDTRNRSLLLFHDVGVGKTCAAIQIAKTSKT